MRVIERLAWRIQWVIEQTVEGFFVPPCVGDLEIKSQAVPQKSHLARVRSILVRVGSCDARGSSLFPGQKE